MDIKTYTNLLANPQKISSENCDELSRILEKYPYFQSARALQLKSYKNENSFLYNDALKLTAAHTTDRNILFDYITSESFTQDEISEVIQQHDESVIEMEVISEDISEQVSIEVNKQIKEELKKAEAILDPDLFMRKQESVESIVKLEPEETLEIDQPLDFTKEDSHSFSEWLKLTKATPIIRDKTENNLTEKMNKFQLIDDFIQKKPKLFPKDTVSGQSALTHKSFTEKAKEKAKNINLSAPYTQSPDSLMTETLAKVYLQQKNYKKALQAYKILSLKNPEKSGFFADQIRAIKKLIQ